jgi:hypothetical protein
LALAVVLELQVELLLQPIEQRQARRGKTSITKAVVIARC